MDFGLLGLDGLVSSETNTNSTVFASSDPEAKQKWYGSGNLKQERSSIADDDNGRSSKMLKMDDNNSNISASKTMLFHQKNSGSSFFPDGQQPAEQMLSFTSPKSDGLLLGRTAQNVTLPYLQYSSASAYNRNSGYNWGSANMHGAVTATRGPFTPSQWMELEHQALIYKYILANVPVPSNLLIPIKKALESAGFPGFSGGILRPNTLGWGSFHLGFSNSTDPEPGRCRRTDGKKWRCSRDAVADQKYCERHMNRGRHRSRKPVEGQNGHSATGTTTTNSKLMPTALSSASVVASGGASNSLTSANQQVKDMQTGASNHPAASSMNRMFLNSENVGDRMVDTPGLSMLSSGDLKYKENPFLIGKQQIPCGEFSPAAFGLVSSDALVNPSHKGNSMVNCRDLSSQDPNAGAGSQSLRHFMDDWPKNQSDRAAVSWPDLDMQQDRTQLSMSIPMASADFMSSTSSPINEKVTLSPLRLSRELDPIQMGLGVGSVVNEPEQRQANCMPISWEQSMGGPLGEVLHSTNNSGSDGKNSSSSLNLTTEGWDSNPWTGSSPTGVLQKSTFGSLSNSSAGSSPRTENKTHEGASHCKEILNSTPGNSSSVPAL